MMSAESEKPSDDSDRPAELVGALAKYLSGRLSVSTESEERSMVQAFLDSLSGGGFTMPSSQDVASRTPATQQDELSEITDRLKQGPLRLRELLSIWRDVSARESAGPAEFYIDVGERILKAGQPLIAHDILRNGIQHWPTNLRLRQLRSLALARSGASRRARTLLQALVEEGHRDEETLGLLARTNKDLWQASRDPAERIELLRESHEFYVQGYERALAADSTDGAIYAGINGATTALLLGNLDTAKRLSLEVEKLCRQKLDSAPDYWALATLGECALIHRRFDEAAEHYAASTRLADRNFADVASTKRNAAMLLESMGESSVELTQWFPMPSIVVFTGHLIDRPDAPVRFPAEQVDQVYHEIDRALEESGAGFGYASAACGGDLLFLEALEKRGGESHIVLPLPRDPFVEASVDVAGERDWVADFDRLLESASQVTVVNEFSRQPQPEHFEYSNHVMTGLAMLQSKALGAEVIPIALWDEKPARGPGGTGTLVEMWLALGWKPRVINPQRLSEAPAIKRLDHVMGGDSMQFPFVSSTAVEVRAMLFADVVGYSKLSEEEIPLFVRDFMGSISNCVAASGIEIETFNTWGDAIYFVFRNVRDAGITALGITEHVNSIDWQVKGFQAAMTLRTGLHVGPVYRIVDPVTNTKTHTGAHVSRAARIEPIAPPGEVFASEAFAAVAAADRVQEFDCDYVGVTPMAKGYGEFATYHVHRKNR